MVERYYDKHHDPEWCNPFRSEGFLRDGTILGNAGAPLPIAALPPFLRALLVTDGTVTKILEAYFWEPVVVDTLAQEFFAAERPVEWIDVGTGDRVLIRRARLIGSESGRIYVTALSVIRTELIPEAFRSRLIDREIGIGVLIRDSGLESYREVLEIGVETVEKSQESPGLGGEVVFRTYRIIIEGAPVILITESFPLALYANIGSA